MNTIHTLIFYAFALITAPLLGNSPCPNSSTHCDVITDVMERHKQFCEKHLGVTLAGAGGRLLCGIDEIFVCYSYPEPLCEDEASYLYTNIVESFLKMLNTSNRLYPFFTTHPLTMDNIRVSLVFVPCSRTIKVPFAGMANRGEMVFFAERKTRLRPLKTAFCRPYADLLQESCEAGVLERVDEAYDGDSMRIERRTRTDMLVRQMLHQAFRPDRESYYKIFMTNLSVLQFEAYRFLVERGRV